MAAKVTCRTCGHLFRHTKIQAPPECPQLGIVPSEYSNDFVCSEWTLRKRTAAEFKQAAICWREDAVESAEAIGRDTAVRIQCKHGYDFCPECDCGP